MKKIVLILTLLVVLIELSSCQKDTPVSEPTLDPDLKPVAVQVVVEDSSSPYVRIY
jgi:hypothetical protein